jgi:NAD(P)-dependent dehydrogenase (short-subunit alcohol dehydrogenase family)
VVELNLRSQALVARAATRAMLAGGGGSIVLVSSVLAMHPVPELEWMAEDGRLDRIVLGMDAARREYYAVYGGKPGLTWLLDGFASALEERGLDAAVRQQLFVDNPARVFAFGPRNEGTDW